MLQGEYLGMQLTIDDVDKYIPEEHRKFVDDLMKKHNVPILDLNSVVHQHCGQEYKSCALCDNETKYHPGIYCGFHYTAQGYGVLAKAVADSFEKLLQPSSISV